MLDLSFCSKKSEVVMLKYLFERYRAQGSSSATVEQSLDNFGQPDRFSHFFNPSQKIHSLSWQTWSLLYNHGICACSYLLFPFRIQLSCFPSSDTWMSRLQDDLLCKAAKESTWASLCSRDMERWSTVRNTSLVSLTSLVPFLPQNNVPLFNGVSLHW